MRYLKERATRRRDRGFRREQIHHRGEVTLVFHEDDKKTETNRLNSSATCAQSLLFLPFIHGSLILSCFKANLWLSLQSSKVSGYFGSESHSHTLSRSEPTSPFLEARSYKATCGKGPRLGSEEVELGRRCFVDCFFKTACRLVRVKDRESQSIFSPEQEARKKNQRTSHAVRFKDGVRCPFHPGRLGHRRLLAVPSSLSQF